MQPKSVRALPSCPRTRKELLFEDAMAPGLSTPAEPIVRKVPDAAVRPESLCVRDRARAGLRECQNLVNQFFQAVDLLVSGREGAGSTLKAADVMKKLVERQTELKALVDDGKSYFFVPILPINPFPV